MSFHSEHSGIPIAILSTFGVQIGEGINQSDGILGVLFNVETLVLSFTVPSGQSFNLERIDVGGTLAAKFTVYLTPSGDPVETIAVRRTNQNQLNETIEFDTADLAKQSLEDGDKIEIKVVHQSHLPSGGDFEARLQGQANT